MPSNKTSKKKKKPLKRFMKMSIPVEDLRKCFGSGEHSDIKITVGDETFNAHMLVLASASPFFARIRTATYGAKDVKIAINTQDPEAARRFLKIVYEVDLDFATGPLATTGNLTEETKLFNLGEHYGVYRARDAALANVKTCLAADYDADDFISACDALYAKEPDADNALCPLYILELRRRWAELAEREGFFKAIGEAGVLTNHVTAFAMGAHFDEDGTLLGPEWTCEHCMMSLAWPGDRRSCPACLHFASLGHHHSPHFKEIFPAEKKEKKDEDEGAEVGEESEQKNEN